MRRPIDEAPEHEESDDPNEPSMSSFDFDRKCTNLKVLLARQ